MSVELPVEGMSYVFRDGAQVVERLNCIRVRGRRIGFAPWPFSCIETQSTRLRWSKAIAHAQANGITITEEPQA